MQDTMPEITSLTAYSRLVGWNYNRCLRHVINGRLEGFQKCDGKWYILTSKLMSQIPRAKA